MTEVNQAASGCVTSAVDDERSAPLAFVQVLDDQALPACDLAGKRRTSTSAWTASRDNAEAPAASPSHAAAKQCSSPLATRAQPSWTASGFGATSPDVRGARSRFRSAPAPAPSPRPASAAPARSTSTHSSPTAPRERRLHGASPPPSSSSGSSPMLATRSLPMQDRTATATGKQLRPHEHGHGHGHEREPRTRAATTPSLASSPYAYSLLSSAGDEAQARRCAVPAALLLQRRSLQKHASTSTLGSSAGFSMSSAASGSWHNSSSGSASGSGSACYSAAGTPTVKSSDSSYVTTPRDGMPSPRMLEQSPLAEEPRTRAESCGQLVPVVEKDSPPEDAPAFSQLPHPAEPAHLAQDAASTAGSAEPTPRERGRGTAAEPGHGLGLGLLLAEQSGTSDSEPANEEATPSPGAVSSAQSSPQARLSNLASAPSSASTTPSHASLVSFADSVARSNSRRRKGPPRPLQLSVSPKTRLRAPLAGGVRSADRASTGADSLASASVAGTRSSVDSFFPAHERQTTSERQHEARPDLEPTEEVDEVALWRGRLAAPAAPTAGLRRTSESSVAASDVPYFTPSGSVDSNFSPMLASAAAYQHSVRSPDAHSPESRHAPLARARPRQSDAHDFARFSGMWLRGAGPGRNVGAARLGAGDASTLAARDLSAGGFLDESEEEEEEHMAMERQQRRAGVADAIARLAETTARINERGSARFSAASLSTYADDSPSGSPSEPAFPLSDEEELDRAELFPSGNAPYMDDSAWIAALALTSRSRGQAQIPMVSAQSLHSEPTPPISPLPPTLTSPSRLAVPVERRGSWPAGRSPRLSDRDSWSSLLSFAAQQDIAALAATTAPLHNTIRDELVKSVMADSLLSKQSASHLLSLVPRSEAGWNPPSAGAAPLPGADSTECSDASAASSLTSPEAVSPSELVFPQLAPAMSRSDTETTVQSPHTAAPPPAPPSPSRQAEPSSHWSDGSESDGETSASTSSNPLKRAFKLKRPKSRARRQSSPGRKSSDRGARSDSSSHSAADRPLLASLRTRIPSAFTSPMLGTSSPRTLTPYSPLSPAPSMPSARSSMQLTAPPSSPFIAEPDTGAFAVGSEPVPFPVNHASDAPPQYARGANSQQQQQHLDIRDLTSPADSPSSHEHSSAAAAQRRASLLASLGPVIVDTTPKLSTQALPVVSEDVAEPAHLPASSDEHEIALALLPEDVEREQALNSNEGDIDESEAQDAGSGEMGRRPPVKSDREGDSSDDYGSSDGGGGHQESGAPSRTGHNTGGGKGRGDDERDDHAKRPPAPRIVAPPAASPSDSEDDYGEGETSEDDVPLGARVDDPAAVQQKIKRRLKRERMRAAAAAAAAAAPVAVTAPTARASTAHAAQGQSARTSPQTLQKPLERARSTAHSGPTAPPPSAMRGLDVTDLSSRLRRVQSARHPSAPPRGPPAPAKALSRQTSLSRRPAPGGHARPEALTVAPMAELTSKAGAVNLSRSSTRSQPPLPPVPRHLAQVIGSPDLLVPEVAKPSPPHSPTLPMSPPLRSTSLVSPTGTTPVATAPAPAGLPASTSSSTPLSPPLAEVTPAAAPAPVAAPPLSPTTANPLIQHTIYLITKQRYVKVHIRPDARVRDLIREALSAGSVAHDDSTPGGWVVFDGSADFGVERPMREYEMVAEVAAHRANGSADYFLLRRTELSPYTSVRSVPEASPALGGYVYVQDRKKRWSKRWLELREHSLYHAKSDSGKNEEHVCSLSNFDVCLVTDPHFKAPKPYAFAVRSQDKITMFEKPDQDYVHYFCLSDPAAHRDWVRNILNARTYVLRQERAALFRLPPVPNAAQALLAEAPHSSSSSASSATGVRRTNSVKRGPMGASAGISGSAVAHMSSASAAAAAGSRGGADASSSGKGDPSHSPHMHAKPLVSRTELFAGPFEKGSLLADVATRGLGLTGTGAAPNAPVYTHGHSHGHGHASGHGHGHGHSHAHGQSHAHASAHARPAEGDFSMHERTRLRMEESARKRERQAAHAAAVAAGRPLLHLGSRP